MCMKVAFVILLALLATNANVVYRRTRSSASEDPTSRKILEGSGSASVSNSTKSIEKLDSNETNEVTVDSKTTTLDNFQSTTKGEVPDNAVAIPETTTKVTTINTDDNEISKTLSSKKEKEANNQDVIKPTAKHVISPHVPYFVPDGLFEDYSLAYENAYDDEFHEQYRSYY